MVDQISRTESPVSTAGASPWETGADLGSVEPTAAAARQSAWKDPIPPPLPSARIEAFGALTADLPAWLVSMVVHTVGLLLLSLWGIEPPGQLDDLTLSTSESFADIEGDSFDTLEADPEALEFDNLGGIEIAELFDTADLAPELFALDDLDVLPPVPPGMMPPERETATALPIAPTGELFAGRDPGVRARMVGRQGGTSATEAAVARGLVWLARYQFDDGHWSLNAWDKAVKGGPPVDGRHKQSDTGATALGLLPFLGAGHTHRQGDYQDTVFEGLKWLIAHQPENGDLRGKGNGQMYAHGQATIALCEAYALTGDSELQLPAQRAINFILDAQHSAGGWRYTPGQAGDTSVVGWQMMALTSGRAAGLFVPTPVFDRTSGFLDSVQRDDVGGRYSYTPGGRITPAMTAEALLCRQYLGWPRKHPGFVSGAEYLIKEHPPRPDRPNIYYWYYATQMLHHHGGPSWDQWNEEIRDLLVAMQRKEGALAGSWEPRGKSGEGGFASDGGRIYMTALALCCLEVYYRHLPLYEPNAIGLPDEPPSQGPFEK